MTKEKKLNKTKTKSKTNSNNSLKKTKTRRNKSTVSQKKHIFGKVYAEWCGACNHLLPSWIKMLNQLKGDEWKDISEEEKQEQMKQSIFIDKNGTILEIIQIQDSDYDNYKSHRQELNSLNASSYPTIFRKIGDSPIEYYKGDRSPEDMISWALNTYSPTMRIMGGVKKIHTNKHNKTDKNHKNHKKSCGACNSGFSQTIAKFWGWK